MYTPFLINGFCNSFSPSLQCSIYPYILRIPARTCAGPLLGLHLHFVRDVDAEVLGIVGHPSWCRCPTSLPSTTSTSGSLDTHNFIPSQGLIQNRF